jgi:hypothetical protein
MIVGAAYVALVNLGLNPGPRCAAPERLADVRGLGFGILMIELQHDWVCLATVDARMRPQKFENSFLIAVSLYGVFVLAAQHVLLPVLGVVPAEVRPTATTAKVVLAALAILIVELG